MTLYKAEISIEALFVLLFNFLLRLQHIVYFLANSVKKNNDVWHKQEFGKAI